MTQDRIPLDAGSSRPAMEGEARGLRLHGPYGWLIKPAGLSEEYWYLARDPSSGAGGEISVALFATEEQKLGVDASSAEAKLLPCPFCGGTKLKSGGDDKIVGTWCLTCEASGPNEYGSFGWNRRALPSAPAPVEGVEQFGMIDEASGHEPLYFGRVNGIEPWGVSGDRYVKLSDYERLVKERDEKQAALQRIADEHLPHVEALEASVARLTALLAEADEVVDVSVSLFRSFAHGVASKSLRMTKEEAQLWVDNSASTFKEHIDAAARRYQQKREAK
jgi:hypothetical protein